jgi:aminopeptidase N
MKRSLILFTFLLSSLASLAAPASRSDSLDIKKTTIYCDITDFASKHIDAHAKILLASKVNGQTEVVFDLEGLTVNLVRWNNVIVSYTQNGSDLIITAPSSFDQGDSATLDIFYDGNPPQDATWGGFYYVGNYAFQMGVGFTAQPHSIGRFWHPCFDNFVERCAYEFFITTKPVHRAVTNGIFQDSTLLNSGDIQWHYKLDEEIPSYLSAVAVSDYVWVNKSLNGNAGITPATIAAPAVDTNKVNGSFANLQSSFSMLEKNFGTHSFPKVGYTLVPFAQGAMEHATNIHIGTGFIDGSLTYETLIAHELAHHWWGDLVTCRTAQDMWLNEGWASYAEQLHQEFTYGRASYLDAYRSNHYNVLNSAHIRDEGYRAISPMDSLHTYGPTVYNKGADVIHTMRTYLGDSLFFSGTTAFLNANKFKDITSETLRDFLSSNTGMNMNDYFDDWIFQPGFPHYSIDSTNVEKKNSLYETSVFLRHRKHQAPNYFSNVPLSVGFYDKNFKRQVYDLTFDGRCMELNVKLGFDPQMIIIDPEERLSDAITDNEIVINSIGLKAPRESKFRVWVKKEIDPADSALLYVQHHWVAPDREIDPSISGYVLNDKRYWKVSGINLENYRGKMQFLYNGLSTDQYIDSSWIQNSEDSIRLFYRPDASQTWTFADDSLRAQNPLDKRGSVFTKEIKTGEFCFGIKRANYTDPLSSDIATGPCALVTQTKDVQKKIEGEFSIFPNPTKGYLIISSKNMFTGQFEIFDLSGKKLWNQTIELKKQLNRIPLPTLSSGVYFIKLSDNKSQFSKKIVIKS